MIVFAKQSQNHLLIGNQSFQFKFSIYNALNSDWEEYLFLKWLVIAIDNEDKKILKFDYYIELKSQQNEV